MSRLAVRMQAPVSFVASRRGDSSVHPGVLEDVGLTGPHRRRGVARPIGAHVPGSAAAASPYERTALDQRCQRLSDDTRGQAGRGADLGAGCRATPVDQFQDAISTRALVRRMTRLAPHSPQMRRSDAPAASDDADSVHYALELANIARPWVVPQDFHGVKPEAFAGSALEQEVPEQLDGILLPLAQGRGFDDTDDQPPIEVFTEPSRRHLFLEVLVSGRDDPEVDLDRVGGTIGSHPYHLPLLQDTRQAYLHRRAQVGNLVEEEHTAVGLLEDAAPALGGAREGSTLVAEQLGLSRRLGDRAAVDGDERTVPSLTEPVECSRHELLACAGLPRTITEQSSDACVAIVFRRSCACPELPTISGMARLSARCRTLRRRRGDTELNVGSFSDTRPLRTAVPLAVVVLLATDWITRNAESRLALTQLSPDHKKKGCAGGVVPLPCTALGCSLSCVPDTPGGGIPTPSALLGSTRSASFAFSCQIIRHRW